MPRPVLVEQDAQRENIDLRRDFRVLLHHVQPHLRGKVDLIALNFLGNRIFKEA